MSHRSLDLYRGLGGLFGPFQGARRPIGTYPGAFWVYPGGSEANLDLFRGPFGPMHMGLRPDFAPFGSIQGAFWAYTRSSSKLGEDLLSSQCKEGGKEGVYDFGPIKMALLTPNFYINGHLLTVKHL